jgi:AcrR family transcriptional regulator
LVHAAIDQIRQAGPDSLTTTSLTAAAGIVQSAFYVHFRDIDECKRAAAEQVATEIRQFVADQRRATGQRAPGDFEALVAHFRSMLDLFQTERCLSELLIRCRHDASPLGEVMRELVEQLRADLLADLAQQFGALPVRPPSAQRLAIYAELILGMVLAAGEALIDGRFRRAEPLARELATSTWAMAQAVLLGLMEAAGQ